MATSSQIRPPLDGINPEEEQRSNEAVRLLRSLREINPSTQWERDAQLESARSIIATLNATSFMTWTERFDDQMFVITEIQNLAYQEADGGGVQDLAQWCIRQYLQIVSQLQDDCVEALTGLGHAWLLRAQHTLGQIHRLEGSSSSGSSGQRAPASTGRPSFTSSDDARESARAVIEADGRAGTAPYVEARGMLLPSTEYLQRAVLVAEQRNTVTGEILSLAAEAHMSLGNVSYSHHNEQYFQQAIFYLRRASHVEGYELSPYLRSYLEEYGRLVP